MNDPIILPSYPDEELAELSPAKLTDILIDEQDRVPRNVIDACVRSGEAMTEYLQQFHSVWEIGMQKPRGASSSARPAKNGDNRSGFARLAPDRTGAGNRRCQLSPAG
jgi:hypothetical protein